MAVCGECGGSGGQLVRLKPFIVADCPCCWGTGAWPVSNRRPLAFTVRVHALPTSRRSPE
jgi:hypothetical protein